MQNGHNDGEIAQDNDQVVIEISRNQLERFTGADPRCRGLELPEGVMLRYALAQSLYFYLRTGVKEGKITTRVFASDTPYDRQKSPVGEVSTPMFEPQADARHLDKVERILYAWVDFVKEEADTDTSFKYFEMNERRD